MSGVFFSELEIKPPDYNLDIGSGLHGQMTGRQLENIERVLIDTQPDFVCVFGDTNSTLAGALAAIKLHIPILHIEAGLRSFNRAMPEEINRVLVDHISSYLFTPNAEAVDNLVAEGICNDKIFQVGDIMYDAVLYYREKAKKPAQLHDKSIHEHFILATIHRSENTDSEQNLREIFSGLATSKRQIILPLHPRAKARIKKYDITIPEHVFIIDPVSYLEMMWLEKHATLIVTDSGGVQKEAYFHSTPCLTLRNETEWPSLVTAGWNKLIGSSKHAISKHINQEFVIPERRELDFGIGKVSERVIATLLESQSN